MPALKSPYEMFQAMKANFVEKTGKSFEAWVTTAKNAGIAKFKPLLEYMKKEHGLTHGYAQMVAWGVTDPSRLESDNHDESLVDALYTGKKEALSPIYDKLISTAGSLGANTDTVICKTYTSIRAKSQFAIFAPRTNSAVDVELALPSEAKIGGRVESFKSSYPKFKHRIRISNPSEVNAEVVAALKSALDWNLTGAQPPA